MRLIQIIYPKLSYTLYMTVLYTTKNHSGQKSRTLKKRQVSCQLFTVDYSLRQSITGPCQKIQAPRQFPINKVQYRGPMNHRTPNRRQVESSFGPVKAPITICVKGLACVRRNLETYCCRQFTELLCTKIAPESYTNSCHCGGVYAK